MRQLNASEFCGTARYMTQRDVCIMSVVSTAVYKYNLVFSMRVKICHPSHRKKFIVFRGVTDRLICGGGGGGGGGLSAKISKVFDDA